MTPLTRQRPYLTMAKKDCQNQVLSVPLILPVPWLGRKKFPFRSAAQIPNHKAQEYPLYGWSARAMKTG